MDAKPDPILQRTDDLPEEHKLQAQFALAAFGTLKARHVAYVSVPITSGPRLYDYMKREGFKTAAEAKADHQKFFDNVVEPNLEQGVAGANAWIEKLDGAVIAPAEFEGRLRRQWGVIDWEQDDFMGMWVPVIDEKVTHMIMLDGWEYSNGSGEEYLQAVLMQMGRRPRSNIEIIDGEDNRPIPLDEGIGLMAKAFKRVHSLGIRPRNMAETLSILIEAERRFNIEQKAGTLIEPSATSKGAVKDRAAPTLPAYSHDKVREIANDVLPVIAQEFPDIAEKLKRTSSYDFSPLNAIFRQVAAPPPKAAEEVPQHRRKKLAHGLAP